MKNNLSITIIAPQAATTRIDNDLVQLTKYLVTQGLVAGTGTYGALGGEYGYGENIENDIFMMHSYCWCEKRDCPWCRGCYCKVERINDEYQTVKECDNCAHPVETLPNFWYKPTDLKIHWYKWIGRSMEFNKQPDTKAWKAIMRDCYESLRSAA